MSLRLRVNCFLTAVIVLGLNCAQALTLSPTDDLQQYLDQAAPGEEIILRPGVYRGNFTIRQPLMLSGEPGAILDGSGRDDTLRVIAPNVVIRNLEIRNWGDDLTAMNAGVYVERTGVDILIENNRLQGDTTGIWLDRTSGAKIWHNRIQGNAEMRSSDRGNGIHLSLVTGVDVRGNEVWHTRDGIYIITSNNNTIAGNELHDLRYGVHYMYSHNNRVTGNIARRTRVGYALMQSKQLSVTGNYTEDNQDYGILMNYITHSIIADNRVENVKRNTDSNTLGNEGKALFIYNSLYNTIAGNRLAHSNIGIHLTAGSEDNRIVGNSFIANPVQVKYVANRQQDWSSEQQGNFWSNYLGWDMNDDGVGDVPFEPNDGIDKLLWKYPEAKLLMHSPAVLALRWAQRQFPVLKSVGVKDSYPLMVEPKISQPAVNVTAISGL